MKKQNSFISIDILRGIAALGVFFYHQHVFSLIGKYTGHNFISIADNFGAEYAVPLFFLISGYCIHLSNLKYIKQQSRLPLKEYYKRRIFRIYPPYLAALLFSVFTNYSLFSHIPSLTDILVHIFVLQGFTIPYFNTINLVLWTISVELAFYVIYPIFYYIRTRLSLNHALLFSLIVSIINIAILSSQPELSLPKRFFVLNLWFAWCCGAYLADKITLGFSAIEKKVFLFFYMAVAVAFTVIHIVPNNLPVILDQVNILIWTAPLVFLISKEKWLQKNNNLLVRMMGNIGLSSYSLYLLHEPLMVLKNYLAHRFLPASLQFTGVCIGILFIPLIAWYSFKYIESPFIHRKKAIAITI